VSTPHLDKSARVSTGVSGLDEILRGGLIPFRSYMVRGGPGSGKTILGLHFLTWAAARGEPTLLITFGESEGQLRRNAERLGFSTEGISFLDLSPDSSYFAQGQEYDIFPPSEVEREPVTARIRSEVSARKPARVFVDGLTQLRHLTATPFQFRKEALAFLRFLCEIEATVLFSSESNEAPDEDLQFIADSVVELDFVDTRRHVTVTKFRGSDFRAGRHTLRLGDSGMTVFHRLLPDDYAVDYLQERIPFGVKEVDELTGGGLERGAITIITGPSGVGKTTLGLQFVSEAARRGEKPVVYVFEEPRQSLIRRASSIGIPIQEHIDAGRLEIVHVEPLRFTADEFALMVREQVERQEARAVMIDSVSGYRLSLHDEDLVAHLHGLAKYLQNMGVAVVLVNEVEAVIGDFRITDVGVSYMADNIIFLRYLELRGEITKAIGVLKKRLGDFEKTLRELTITSEGVRLGPKLRGLRGIMRGTPVWESHPEKDSD
jgi:circadian clock protein KaiC